jgi:CHASE2 domain-containing sensor protein
MLGQRPSILFWNPWQEGFWILFWAIAGGILAWVCVDLRIFLGATGGALVALVGLSFVLFNGWALWLLMVPAGLAIVGAACNTWIALGRQNNYGSGSWRR